MICHPKLPSLATACFLALITLSFASKASAETKDVCGLVVAVDVEAVLGEPVRSPQRESHSSSKLQTSTCRFLPSQSTGKYLSVMMYEIASDEPTKSPSMSDLLKNLNFKNVQEVPGVGIEAAWGSMPLGGKLVCQMYARKDKLTWISIVITGLADDADTLNRVKILANQVLSKASQVTTA